MRKIMKLSYKKRVDFKLFGKKIFEFNTDYIEHSIDVNSDEDEFNINLNTATINKEK